MKKSFCDICGELAEAIEMNHRQGKDIYITLEIRYGNENCPLQNADLCKKCARELLDKIEL